MIIRNEKGQFIKGNPTRKGIKHTEATKLKLHILLSGKLRFPCANPDYKRCSKCKKELPKSNFSKNYNYCKKCHSITQKKYQEEKIKNLDYLIRYKNYRKKYQEQNKEKLKQRSISSSYKRRYGINISDKQNILIKQGYKCAICEKDLTFSKAHIDHNHISNKIRGCLCQSCNQAIKSYSNVVLSNMISYLMSSNITNIIHKKHHSNKIIRTFKMNRIKEQNNKCPICGTIYNEKNIPVLDHDKITMFIRNIICYNCNTSL